MISGIFGFGFDDVIASSDSGALHDESSGLPTSQAEDPSWWLHDEYFFGPKYQHTLDGFDGFPSFTQFSSASHAEPEMSDFTSQNPLESQNLGYPQVGLDLFNFGTFESDDDPVAGMALDLPEEHGFVMPGTALDSSWSPSAVDDIQPNGPAGQSIRAATAATPLPTQPFSSIVAAPAHHIHPAHHEAFSALSPLDSLVQPTGDSGDVTSNEPPPTRMDVPLVINPTEGAIKSYVRSFKSGISKYIHEVECSLCVTKGRQRTKLDSRPSNLERHLFHHFGVKTHGCLVCRKQFTTRDQAVKHCVDHHSKTREIAGRSIRKLNL